MISQDEGWIVCADESLASKTLRLASLSISRARAILAVLMVDEVDVDIGPAATGDSMLGCTRPIFDDAATI